ncbi:MAG: apolipoprotein N-acyltransferase [Bacteroidia bacterium]
MTQNRKLRITILSVLPALLFWLAWPPRDLFFLGFVGFVPLLFLEREIRDIKYGRWLIYTSLLLWNVAISWWVWNAEPISSIVMMVANAALMFLPWWAYGKARTVFDDKKAYLVLISLWLAYEYLHLNWQITWPWFTLGNIFAKHNDVVQWYEITGTLGGSLWILISNIFFYATIRSPKAGAKKWIKPSLFLIIPILISFVFKILSTQVSYLVRDIHEVLLVQPNIDPYKKFNEGEEVPNLVKMLGMIEEHITDSTKYIILPETAVVEYIDEDYPTQYKSIQLLQEFVNKHKQIHLVTGVSTYNFYSKGEEMQETARESNGQFYESYNTAMEVSPGNKLDFYHKSKLVPGAEKMPYPKVFKFLESFALDLGGITGSLGSDKEAKNFDCGEKPDVAPLICYESVFPGHVAEFTRRGSEILLVITNDGWWKDTDGYKQHMYYSCLRAIENRREVLRSANTGISCRIDKLGNIQEQTEWWEPTVLKVKANNYRQLTFYAKYGDYIGRFASFIGIFFLLGMFVKKRSKLGS